MTSTYGINIFGHGIHEKKTLQTDSKIGSTTDNDITLVRNNVDVLKLSRSGIDVHRNPIINLTIPTEDTDAVNKYYVDTQDTLNIKKTGDTMTGNLDMNSFEILHVSSPHDELSATSKQYVDERVSTAIAHVDNIYCDRVPAVDLTSISTPAPYWCSCDNYSHTAWNAFAHNGNSDWVIGNVTTSWIMVYSADPFCIKRLLIRGSRSGLLGEVTSWKFVGTASNDIWNEEVWDVLFICEDNPRYKIYSNSSFEIVFPSNTRRHRHFMLLVDAGTLPTGINYIGIYNAINTVDIYGDNKMAGNLDMNTNVIEHVADPFNSQDAATKFYVDSKNAKSYSTSAALEGVTFQNKQVHRYFQTGSFPNEGSSVTLISNASSLVRYEGQVVWGNQTHEIRALCAKLSDQPITISPVHFSGSWMTVGGNILLFNTSGVSDFDGANYWVMIEYTVD